MSGSIFKWLRPYNLFFVELREMVELVSVIIDGGYKDSEAFWFGQSRQESQLLAFTSTPKPLNTFIVVLQPYVFNVETIGIT